MKPFNLEECIAGKPVVTRDGRRFRMGGYNPDAATYKIAGWVGDSVQGYCETGRKWANVENSDNDLFMASEKKEGWIILFNQGNGYKLNPSTIYEKIFEAIEEAERIIKILNNKTDYKIIKIEWEE